MKDKKKRTIKRLLSTSWFWIPVLPIDLLLKLLVEIGDLSYRTRECIGRSFHRIGGMNINNDAGGRP